MSNIYVEREENEYVAYQNKRIITTGRTQEDAAEKAHRLRPDDPVLAERQRHTKRGNRDKWRRIYPSE